MDHCIDIWYFQKHIWAVKTDWCSHIHITPPSGQVFQYSKVLCCLQQSIIPSTCHSCSPLTSMGSGVICFGSMVESGLCIWSTNTWNAGITSFMHCGNARLYTKFGIHWERENVSPRYHLPPPSAQNWLPHAGFQKKIYIKTSKNTVDTTKAQLPCAHKIKFAFKMFHNHVGKDIL